MTIKSEAPPPGVYRNIVPDIYHGWDAASNSVLSRLVKSPAHMKAYLDEPPADTDALFLGRAIHAAVLEPDRFGSEYVAMPEGLKRTTIKGKEVYAELVEKYSEECVLKANDFEMCHRIRDSVLCSNTADGLISGHGDVELSMTWHDSRTNVLCKARWDRYSPDIAGGAIVDLKTTRDASPREFERTIFSYGYHRQAAMYLFGARSLNLPARHFSIIAVEKTPPYGVAVYRITEGVIDAVKEQLDMLLEKYAKCKESGIYECYPDEVQDISIPDWAWRQIDNQTDEIGGLL